MSSCLLPSAALPRQPLGQSPHSASSLDSSFDPFASDRENGRDNWVLLGESVAVRRLRSQISRVAPYFRTALIRGEPGTGKEFVARAIHALSPGAQGPFTVADVRLLAESVDREDFHLPGPTSSPAAALESTLGGTLYLTPVAELSLGQQEALLQFLQGIEERRGKERRLYSRNPRMRILAASDRDLRPLAAVGQFARNLYVRLSTVEIFVPPLRQRIDDIPILGMGLLRRFAEETGQTPKSLAESAVQQLQMHPWPDNLRELERVVSQSAALAEGALIEPRHLLALFERKPAVPAAPKSERLHDVMQLHVLDVLARCGGNKVRAAELLGISRSTLYRMLGVTPANLLAGSTD